MFKTPFLMCAALALCLSGNAAWSQSATAPAAPVAPPGKMMAKPRTAQSIACSSQADQQNLHGKPRKTFMNKCKHGKV